MALDGFRWSFSQEIQVRVVTPARRAASTWVRSSFVLSAFSFSGQGFGPLAERGLRGSFGFFLAISIDYTM